MAKINKRRATFIRDLRVHGAPRNFKELHCEVTEELYSKKASVSPNSAPPPLLQNQRTRSSHFARLPKYFPITMLAIGLQELFRKQTSIS